MKSSRNKTIVLSEQECENELKKCIPYGKYDGETIYKWLTVFIRRFFTQQFKRACSPDGVRIGSVSLSKNDFKMVSDFSYKSFLAELEEHVD